MKIALAGTKIKWEAKSENLDRVEKILSLLTNESKVDIIFFPEMSLTGFSMNTQLTMEDMDGFTISAIKELSKRYDTAIGVGWVMKKEPLPENHYSIIEGERVIFDYAKLHPFSYSGEDKYFVGGSSLSTCDISGFRIGAQICYDLRFPEPFQALSKKADLIVVPANWPAKRREHWLCLLQARAIENQCFIAGVNACGNINGQSYRCDLELFAPDGQRLLPEQFIFTDKAAAAPGSVREAVYIYDIENNTKKIRKCFPVKKDRREELYKGWEAKEQ